MAKCVIFRLMDFKFLISPKQRWHRSRCCSHVNESAASNSPSKKAWRTSSHSGQAPAVLMLDSGAGGRIMAMRTMYLKRERQLAGLTMTLPFMFGWIEHK
jgi:hypothetical protein